MSYVYVVTVWGHTGDSNTQPGSGDTWRHVATRGSSLLSLMSPGRRARALAACYLLQLGGQSLYLLLIRLFPLVGLDSSEALQLVLCCDPSVAQPVFTITEKALLGAFSVIVQLHRLIVHSSTQHQHHHTSTSTPATSASPTPPCLHCPHLRSSSSQLTFSSETSRDLRLLPTTLSSSSSSTILDSPVSALSSARSRSASTMASFLATWAAAR